MQKWKFYIPEGVQDILSEECVQKREVEKITRQVFKSCGFMEIEPPSIEFYDVFSGKLGSIEQENMFKFFDQQGRILVLRPDMTTSIARIASTKLREDIFPVRFSYIGNVFRFDEQVSAKLKQREFTQAGVEILGYQGPEADAEVISTVIEAIRQTGLESFQIEIGQIEFFKGLMEQARFSDEETEKIRILIENKDYFGIEMAIKDRDIDQELKNSIMKLPQMFGEIGLVDKIYDGIKNERSQKALDNLREICSILKEYGFEKYISIDLGMVQSINYYTGMIFKGLTHGVGFSICGGGRYDKLTSDFGKEIPATGGAIGINRLMLALDRQKIKLEHDGVQTLIIYSVQGRKTAARIATELRRLEVSVEVFLGHSDIEEGKEYAKAHGIEGIIHVADENSIKVCDLASGNVIDTTFKQLLEK